MGVSTRHARRITTAYREEGAAALAHGHRGRRPVNATSEAVTADVVHLAGTRYQGANHTHLSELPRGTGRHPHRPDHPATHSAGRRSEQSAPSPSSQAPGPSPADAPSGHADPAGRQLSPVVGGPQPTVHAAAGGGRRHRLRGQRLVLPAGRQPQLLPADAEPAPAPRRSPSPSIPTATPSSSTRPDPGRPERPPSSDGPCQNWVSR